MQFHDYIIAVATRDPVELAKGPRYEAPIGRRDGLESKASQVNIPSPTVPIPQVAELFKDKGFSAREMISSGRGVLKLDQDLPFLGLTSGVVSQYRENLEVFRADFAKAMM
ncbi:hypothetical protein Patl1_23540 [Pistacia atlantica]|uniref:Uncharacterized protein n=1 Tax=Pistacia atlantica TaxID=434234 RepID=A0ACC1A1Y7_9ROSI|nr:hypothetical protein Patl1_23540 [Pistacia atlantica]